MYEFFLENQFLIFLALSLMSLLAAINSYEGKSLVSQSGAKSQAASPEQQEVEEFYDGFAAMEMPFEAEAPLENEEEWPEEEIEEAFEQEPGEVEDLSLSSQEEDYLQKRVESVEAEVLSEAEEKAARSLNSVESAEEELEENLKYAGDTVYYDEKVMKIAHVMEKEKRKGKIS